MQYISDANIQGLGSPFVAMVESASMGNAMVGLESATNPYSDKALFRHLVFD